MAGLFEIGTSAIGVGTGLQSKSGLGGSFFSGLLATVVATPCSAPFLGTALGATLALPPSHSMLIFTLIGLGLASPFLLLSIFPGLVSALPRPGAWMESFKQGMSFLLFGTVGFMLYVLTNQIEGLPLLFAHPQPRAHRPRLLDLWPLGAAAQVRTHAEHRPSAHPARHCRRLMVWHASRISSTQSFHRDRKSKRP
jgi:thiol:disulfide interchange protein